MSQKIIIGVLAAVILIGGGAWYYQSQSGEMGSANLRSGERGSSAQRAGEDERGLLEGLGDMLSGSFTDLMARGQAAYCTFDGIDPETGEAVTGSIYVQGENFAMEADTRMEGEDLTMNIISTEKVMYMWSDNEDIMPAMKIDMSMFPDEGPEQQESPIAFLEDPESGVDYSCRGWIARASIFEPPKDIEFYDMFGGMMGAFGSMMQGMDGESPWNFEENN